MPDACPCGKGKPFEQCCGRFLKGHAVPKTPEQLMRSRFSAYALGNYGDYLLQTWFPATAPNVSAEELSQSSVNWQRLEVLTKSQHGDEGSVEFKAYFTQRESSGGGDVMHEVSDFKRINGRWYYVGGVVSG